MTDKCDCPNCRISQLAQEVADLRQRVDTLEESRSLPVRGVVGDCGIVNWHDKEQE